MPLYIENCELEKTIKQKRAKCNFFKNYLKNLSNSKQPSQTIHIILVNNVLHQISRKEIIKNVNNIVNKYKNDHLMIVYYGEDVKEICPIISVSNDIIEPISEIINVDYDFTEVFTKEVIMNMINMRSGIDQVDFAFLSEYEKVFIYE